MTLPFDLPAPSTCQTVYVVFQTWHSPVFLVNSHLALFAAAASGYTRKECHRRAAFLIPKLRNQFAEFLNGESLARLRILTPPTCVGLRYGHPKCSLGAFLGSWHRSLNKAFALRTPLEYTLPDLPGSTPIAFNEAANAFRDLARSVPPSLSPPFGGIALGRRRNVDLLSIDYAFRPRLRIRLTLGGLTLPQETLGLRRKGF